MQRHKGTEKKCAISNTEFSIPTGEEDGMAQDMNRRDFVKGSVVASAAGALALNAGTGGAAEPAEAKKPLGQKDTVQMGKIGELKVSRLMLGGNLLTHFTHSRDLKYVYNLTAHYNTEAKILETLAIAESHGINTLSMHNPPGPMNILKKYRREGGKIQWIICPTAELDDKMEGYTKQVKELVDEGCEAIYLWGVRGDQMLSKMDLVRRAVEIAKGMGVPSGVGCHNTQVVVECEKNKIPADFYIKTFHHHNYPSAKLNHDSMWCQNPEETAQIMAAVEKPWIAFKVMAAGAIQPKDAFNYAFGNGADHVLAGMFDYEIAEDVTIAKSVLSDVKRTRAWRS